MPIAADRERIVAAQADMMFAILKNLAENDQAIHGEGTSKSSPTALASCSPKPTICPAR
jgi:hypothetical protein